MTRKRIYRQNPCIAYFVFTSFFRAVVELAQSKPESLKFIAGIIREFKVDRVFHTCCTVLFGGGWFIEHRRNRRLVQKTGDFRHELEHNDPCSTRSGLSNDGTMKGE